MSPHPRTSSHQFKSWIEQKDGVRGNSPAWLSLNWDIGFILPLDSNWDTDSSWVSSLLAFRLEPHHWLSWGSRLPTAGHIGSKFILCIYMCVYIHTHIYHIEYIYTQTNIHIYMYIDTYALVRDIYIHTHMHTHTHTYLIDSISLENLDQ